ncbi:hypothetical protein G6F59_017758 [Rhizopus arrhizus]|nr:hypothetical protein G6F59_017758 [Rhizopus arrhizus]
MAGRRDLAADDLQLPQRRRQRLLSRLALGGPRRGHRPNALSAATHLRRRAEQPLRAVRGLPQALHHPPDHRL